MGLTLLEILLGAALSILTTVWFEKTRKPVLGIADPHSDDLTDQSGKRPAVYAKFLYVKVHNTPRRRLALL